MKAASRIQELQLEGAFSVLQKARALEAQGKHIIHLEIGEPDFDTPNNVVDAGKSALDAGWTHYGPTLGYEDFRQAIAEHVAKTRGVPVEAKNVCVVPGGKPMIFFPILALVEAGDEVILPNPSFPTYASAVRFAGATPISIPLVEENDFSFDMQRLRDSITPKTKLLILNSPANPTGGVIPAADIREIARLAVEHDFYVFSDEIYSRMYFDEAPRSVLSEPGMLERTILLDGFSKTYAMTGWRLGYGVMPEWMLDAMQKLLVNAVSCTASMVQRAGLAALTGDQSPVDRMMAEFRERRQLFVSMLNEIPGVHCRMPNGAFYAFPNIKGTGMSSEVLADRLLREAGVAALAGTAFGEYGEGYLRFSYANSRSNLAEAAMRMKKLCMG
ncbi:pyridoxal phosphate-dependent aminotransferase [Bryobacter aggregatus]|uniref:pyridoxal phosphate-dependent aminotransferase n=1 Tax=Bryobacter aggregatus TaxID=360054 RepID=UPI0004E26C76|nr:pyridoxal phosphate-dependent aminotransferase [Bryobacter aggregatus]